MDKIQVIAKLEKIRNFAEQMAYHAEQIAPRTVDREYWKIHPEYIELLEHLKENMQ